MSTRADDLGFPPAPRTFRWLVFPAVAWALVATATAALKRRAQQPSVPPMSDTWLRGHTADGIDSYPY